MSKQLLLILFFFSVIVSSKSQVLSLREQSRVMDELLAERFDSLLPQLMQKNNIDMWIVMSREYNEDPVLRTMLPSTWPSARRKTILVFYNDPSKSGMKNWLLPGIMLVPALKPRGICSGSRINGMRW